MAINAYTGLMGSGKSYEVVLSVILPALKAGRRVVTNVSGLQVDDIEAYIVDKMEGDAAKIGEVVQVPHSRVGEPDFFPVEAVDGAEPRQSVVLPGDLVVIDECWRWWASDSKIGQDHMTFFRMHRHFVDPVTSGTCDLVLVVQDVSDLHRKLKVVVESTFRMSKHKALGSDKRYRVDVYSGYKVTARAPKLREIQRSYDPEIFALYSSYSQSKGGGKEGVIDRRTTIWGGALFSVVLPLLVVLGGVSAFFVHRFFNPPQKQPSQATARSGAGAAPAGSTAANAPAAAPNRTPVSEWRIAGHFRANGRHNVLLVKGQAVRMVVDPIGFSYDGNRVSGMIDGEILTEYNGLDAAQRDSILPSVGAK